MKEWIDDDCQACQGSGMMIDVCDYPHGHDFEPPFERCTCQVCPDCEGTGDNPEVFRKRINEM